MLVFFRVLSLVFFSFSPFLFSLVIDLKLAIQRRLRLKMRWGGGFDLEKFSFSFQPSGRPSMGCDLWYALRGFNWEQCIREAEGREIGDS